MSDDWFGQFVNDHFRPYMQRDKGGYINKGLDYLVSPDQKNEYRYHMANVPFVGSFYRAQDISNYWSDYMNNRGLSWADVKYPTMMMGAGQSVGSVMSDAARLMSLSKTAGRLYEGLKQDFGDWTPSKQPKSFQPSYIGIRKINGKGQFYRWDY